MCCSAGKVQLERLKQLPEPLYSLVNALHPDHVQFMNNIRKYNSKNLIKETQTGDDGYPKFKRRSTDDSGFSVNIKGVDIDNRWIVPYNPVLLRTCNAQVNVE
jgi:hypothetical protein